MKQYIGVDIGGTTVKAAVVDENGKIVRRSTIPTLPTRPFAEVAADIAKQIQELSAGEKIEGAGVGCPGTIDSASGVVKFSANLYWTDAPLGEELGKRTGLSVRVSNDANVAAFMSGYRCGGKAGEGECV